MSYVNNYRNNIWCQDINTRTCNIMTHDVIVLIPDVTILTHVLILAYIVIILMQGVTILTFHTFDTWCHIIDKPSLHCVTILTCDVIMSTYCFKILTHCVIVTCAVIIFTCGVTMLTCTCKIRRRNMYL